jgi:putative cobalt transporter subunit CbtB
MEIPTGRVYPEEVLIVAQAPAQPVSTATPLPVVPLREILPWALFVGAVLFVLYYLVGAEQGATSMLSGTWVHEFVHDGRHLLGFPCH